MKLIIHTITIMLAQMGVYVWYAVADFSKSYWCDAYYIWDKAILLLLVLCCINPMKLMLPFWVITGIFFAVRLSFEFVAMFTEVARILFDYRLMFLINIVCTLLVIRKSLRCPKQK